jgi:hypothetical protein
MSNLYQRFRGLLPKSTTLICLVVDHHPDGTSTVELPNGDRFKALGTSVTEAAYAYVRDGVIVGEAPEAPAVVEFEV